MCRTYVLLLRFRYSFHRAIRGLDVFVVQCISTPWTNLELQRSVRLGKSWLTTARQRLHFVTSPVRSYDVTIFSNFCSKHSGTLFTIRSFGALHIHQTHLHTGMQIGVPRNSPSSSRALSRPVRMRTIDDFPYTVVDGDRSMPPRQPSQQRLVWRVS